MSLFLGRATGGKCQALPDRVGFADTTRSRGSQSSRGI